MRSALVLLFTLLGATHGQAADLAAGKAKAEACAACHGGDGVSVSADIPNLAGQKSQYLSTQLKAFREGTRKNPLMNAVAVQLDDEDIENLAAHFNSLPGASGAALSELVAAVTETRVAFPEDYKASYTLYTTIDFPKRKQVRHYYANQLALAAARAGAGMPQGSLFLVEIFKAKLDAAQTPVTDSDGRMVPDKLVAYTAMETQPGWGDGFPDLLRNGDWNYAVFDGDGTRKQGVNQAKCLACHKPLADDSYVFSLAQLQDKARTQP